jgi:hypothetical protein
VRLWTAKDWIHVLIVLAAYGVLLFIELTSRATAQQGPRINPLTQVTSYNPSAVLFWYVGTASGLPSCGVPQSNGSPGPPLASLAYITGPPDQIEACMQGSAGPEWVQVVTAP